MNNSAILVKRIEPNNIKETTDIESLAYSAGFNVVEKVIQEREESNEYNIGSGKLDEIKDMAFKKNIDAIIIDNNLGPYQMYNIAQKIPRHTRLLNRYTLILDIFEKRAESKETKLQIKMAKLRYELPRAEDKIKLSNRNKNIGFMGLQKYSDNQVKIIKDRIKNVKDKLSKIKKENKYRRQYQRDLGFNLVSIAGYTNSGKSTLFRRLSEPYTVSENIERHDDLQPIAKSENVFFTTLDSITRRLNYDERNILITDTLGFIDDAPHWLIDSFETTYDNIYNSDIVLLTIDVTNPTKEIIRRTSAAHDILSYRNQARIITVLNKCDMISDEELERKKRAIDFLAPTPVSISAKKGQNITELKERIHRTLPPFETDRIMLPLQPKSMSLISWIYNNASVINCEYTYNGVMIEYEAETRIISKAKSKLKNIG